MTKKEKEFLKNTKSNHHSYDEFDTFLIEKTKTHPFPQTQFQCDYFVSGSHPTLYRQVRQTLLEINTRKHSLDKLIISKRKLEVEMKRQQDKISNCEDLYDKQILEIELDDMKIDMGVYEKKIEQAHIEMRYFLDFVKGVCEKEEDTQKFFDLDAEEEKKYWIARMAKQSSVDLISSGRLGSGNIDSILMMSEEDQVATLQLALNYAGAIGAGVENLKLNAEKEIKFLGEGLPNQKYLEESVEEKDI